MDSSTQQDLSQTRGVGSGTQPQPHTGQKLQMLFMTLSEVWYSMSWSDVPAGVQYTMYGLGLLTVIFMARKFIQKTAGMVHGILQVMHGILQATGMVHGIRQASDPRGIQSSTGIQDIMTMLEKMQQVLDGHSQGLESLTQSVSLLSGVPSGDGLWEKLSEKFDAILVSFQEPNQKITRRFQVVDAACEKLQELLHQTTDMLGKMMKTVDALSTQSSMEIVAQAIEKTTAQLEKVGPQLDQCLQNIAAASNAEKGRFTMLDGAIKNKIDQVHGEVVAKLGSVETTHSKLQGFLPQLQSAIGKLDSLPDKLDRTESLFRERDKACRKTWASCGDRKMQLHVKKPNSSGATPKQLRGCNSRLQLCSRPLDNHQWTVKGSRQFASWSPTRTIRSRK